MALAGLAAMNQQTLPGSGVMQMENTGGLSSYQQAEADQGTTSAPTSTSSNAAMALGMLAQSMNNGNAYNADENQNNEQSDRSDQYQSG